MVMDYDGCILYVIVICYFKELDNENICVVFID